MSQSEQTNARMSEHTTDCGGCDIGRRAFLIQGALAAAAMALAACTSATGLGDNGNGNLGGSASIKVSDYPSLANVGGVAMLTLSGAPVAIVRTGASSFLALSRICPHQGGTIGEVQGEFQCPVHGATFNLNGQWIGGQPTSNMRAYTSTYDAASGTLTIS